MAFHELLGALDKNQVDLVICGLSVTPERSLRVNFSEPYMTSKMAILHKVSDKFSSYDDLTDKMPTYNRSFGLLLFLNTTVLTMKTFTYK